MTSLTAGSPKCNCKNPDTCIHSFSLNVDKKVFTYKQNDFFSSIAIINKSTKPIVINLSLIGKKCETHNPECPKGLIYNVEDKSSLQTFTQGKINYNIDYNNDSVLVGENYNAISFIARAIFGEDAHNWLPHSEYILRVGQCQGESFVNEDVSFLNGVRQVLGYAPRDRLWSIISVYPSYDWKINVTIGLNNKVAEYSDKELRKQQVKENRESGLEQRKAAGWTKRPRYSINKSLDIDGTLSFQLGHTLRHDFSQKLKVDFKKKSKDLSLLDNATKTLDLVGKCLSTKEDAGTKYKILNTEIIYPKLSIGGGAELSEDNKTNQLYMKGKVSVGFTPLIGIKINFDLLQAFAAWYGSASVVDIIRQQLAAREESVKQGDNGAYAGLKFDLIISGIINLSAIWENSSSGRWAWRLDGDNEVKLPLAVEANARAGVKFTVIEGVFSVEGSVQIFGKALAEGIIAFDQTPQNHIEVIFYHNGIKIEVGASYSGSIATSNSAARSTGSRRSAPAETIDARAKRSNGAKKEWILHEKLDKKDSTNRVRIL